MFSCLLSCPVWCFLVLCCLVWYNATQRKRRQSPLLVVSSFNHPPSLLHTFHRNKGRERYGGSISVSLFLSTSIIPLCLVRVIILSLPLSCLVLSCLVLSCLILSCLVLLVSSRLVLSCLVLSCLVLSLSWVISAFVVSLSDKWGMTGSHQSMLECWPSN